MKVEVELQHAFPLADGLQDFDILAEVDLSERIVRRIATVVTATKKHERLSPKNLAKAEELALECADELAGDWERWADDDCDGRAA